jgi:iron complex outermembrane receptor protein
MNTPLRNLRVIFVVCCIFGLIHAACAAEDSDIEPMELVVSTPTRTKISLSDAPAAVTMVTAKEIKAKNVSRLGDVLDQVPSLYLRDGALGQSQGTSGTSGMSLRGVDQSRTLILLDGQPIQDARSGKVNWQVPFIEDIARVEVVPGAFSSLYGSNAIGGVINIITKQPDRHEFDAKVRKGWGDASGEDASVYLRDKLDNGLGIAAGLGYQNRDSYVNDFVVKTPAGAAGPIVVTGAQPITTRDGTPAYLVGDKGTTPWHSANGTVKLFYDLNAKDKIYTGIVYQETNQGYTQFNTYLRDTTTGLPVSSGSLNINGQGVALTESNFVNNSPLHEAATRYFVGYDGTLGNGYSLKVDLAKIKRAYSFTFSGSTVATTWNGGPGTLYDTPNTGLDGSAQLTFPVGTRQVLVTGLALHNDTANQQVYTLADWRNPDTRTVVTSSYNGDSTTTSVFAQDEIGAADGLTVYLGGRLDNWQTKGDSTVAANTLYPTRSATAFSPKVSAVYRATETATLRASFGRSFRAPTNEDMYTTSIIGPRTTKGDPNLQPEHGSTWEAGGELRITENTKVTATCYETQLSNLIYLQQVSSSLSLRINAGKARIRGIELGAASKLSSWLELDANYAYIDSTMLENLADPLSVGQRLTDSPKNIAGIGLTAQQGAWSGTLNTRYVSHSFFTAHNTDVVEGVPGSYDAHTIVNAKLGYEFAKGVKGALDINNLLNVKAYSYFLLPSRNVTAEMDFSF